MKKKNRYTKLDYKALNTSGVLTTRYTPEGRAQIRGAKPSFAKRVTRRTDNDEEGS